MAGVDDLDTVLEQFKRAGNEFVKGNPKPVQEMWAPKRRPRQGTFKKRG
jgi:hypothetical protein